MKKIIIVNGFPYAGKDAFIDECCSQLALSSFKSLSLSVVDRVKEAATLLGWDREKDTKGRDFLYKLNTLSETFYDGPYTYITSRIALVDPDFAFVCARSPELIKRLKSRYGEKCLTVLVVRPDKEHSSTNPADTDVLNYPYDVTVYNGGSLNDLTVKIRELVDGLS